MNDLVIDFIYCVILFVFIIFDQPYRVHNRIGCVMVNVVASRAVDRGSEPRSCQTKDYKLGIRCFYAKHAALKRKNKDWFAQNQNNVSEQSDMFTVYPRTVVSVS